MENIDAKTALFKLDQSIFLRISEDKMEAFLSASFPLSNPITEAELMKLIRGHIRFGIEEEVVHDFLQQLEHMDDLKEVRIATGQKPVHGEDGKWEYAFEVEKAFLPKLNPDGTVNYKEIDTINKITAGEIVAQMKLPTVGTSGRNVMGEEIPSYVGKMPSLKYGKNLKLSEDGSALYSQISGLIEVKSGKIQVHDVYKTDKIDGSTGNIEFDGNVIVFGDVLNGFSLKSTGPVEIRGKVEGGTIFSDSDILIRQGVQGYNKYKIETKGSLSTKFIENALIFTDKNITAEAIMHSEVESGGNIICIGKKGLIVGGTIKAKSDIVAKTIGSTMATSTIIEVGTDPKYRMQYEQFSKKIEENREKLEKIINNLKILEVLKKSEKLDGSKNELYENLLKAEHSLNLEIDGLSKKLIVMEEELQGISKGMVKVTDTIYPGVKIVIGAAFMFVREEMHHCSFYKEGMDIRVGPY